MFKKIKIFSISLILALVSFINAYAYEDTWKTVDYIIDGDTFVTEGGEHVRLLGINTPEVGRHGNAGEPFSNQARLKLTKLIFNQNVRLSFGERHKDRYGRMLAHIYKEDGIWVNNELVQEGLAHVYSFPDNRQLTRELIKAENEARAKNKGMWAHPRWKTYKSVDAIPDEAIGQFNLYEGKIVNTTRVSDRIYLNFGTNWRTDFTVEIPKRYYELFKKSGINIEEDYKGKKVQIRGVFKPVNGVLVTSTHPEQLTFLD